MNNSVNNWNYLTSSNNAFSTHKGYWRNCIIISESNSSLYWLSHIRVVEWIQMRELIGAICWRIIDYDIKNIVNEFNVFQAT